MKKGWILLIIVFVIFHSSLIISVCREMIGLLIDTYLPSMFILLVLAKLCIFQSTSKSYWIRFLSIDSNCFQLIQSMIMTGYPVQVALVYEQYETHHITEKQALRLIYSLSLPSLAFSLMTLTALISLKEALLLYMVQLMCCFCFLFSTRSIPISFNLSHMKLTFMNQLKQAIRFAFLSLVNILAFLMIIGSIKAIMLHYIPFMRIPIVIMLEFSSACFEIDPVLPLLPSLAFILGFGSFSIHLQVASSCTLPHFSYWKYLGYRIIQGILSAWIIWIIVK